MDVLLYSHSTPTRMAPTKQLAVVINAEGGVDLKEVDVPKPGSGEILVKVVAAAQNPTDWSVPFFSIPTHLISMSMTD